MAKITRVKNSKGKRYRIDYYDAQGVRHRDSFEVDLKTAKEIANRLEYKRTMIKSGMAKNLKPNIGLVKAVNKYYQIAEVQKKRNTIQREKYIYDKLIKYIGDIRIRHVDLGELQNYIARRYSKDKISPATVRIEIKTLRAFFNTLISHGYLDSNPTIGLKGPNVETKPIRFLTQTEIYNLINTIDCPNFKDLIIAYLNTGARKEELLPGRCTWDNVEFETRVISITGKRDKTRIVPLNKTMFDILHRRKNIENREFPFNFNYQNIYPKLKFYYKQAGIKNADVHALRRTFGSLLVQNGISIYIVSKLLGHTSVTITENHYAELLEENLLQGVKTLDDLIEGIDK